MKSLSKISLFSTALLLSACQMQDSAEIVYDLDDYIGQSTATSAASPTSSTPVNSAKSVSEMVGPAQPIQSATVDDLTTPVTTAYQAPDSVEVEKIENIPSAPQSDVAVAVDTNQEYNVPAPVQDEGDQVIKISGATHVVGKGDTLYSLSRKYDIPIMPIIIANNLQVPFDLANGQIIKIPEGSFHVVKPSDTLYSISRKYGVDMSALTKINGLSEPFSISTGQKLQIPFPTYHTEEAAAQPQQAQAEQGPVSAPVTENLFGNKQDVSENTPKPLDETETNTNLVKTDSATGGPASLQKAHQNLFTFKNDKAVYDKDAPQKIAEAIQPAQKSATEFSSNTSSPSITPAKIVKDSRGVSKTGFMWPVEGNIVKKFGSQSGNEYSDGINIAASAGTSVKASSAGRVVYTGDSLKSYGNLVIVKHDNGLLSAYAHLDKMNVTKDQKISQGQVIGTVGSSGKVSSPQLYFAIRKGKDARDPKIYLP